MGLDGVEIVMEVEERFGVTLSDEETGGVRTVGDLLGLLESRVARRQAGECLSLPAFLQLRRAVREVTQFDRRIRPSDLVTDVLDEEQRRQLWDRLPVLLNSYPTGLARPSHIERRIWIGVFAVSGTTLWLTAQSYDFGWALLALGLAFVLSAIFFYRVTEPLCTEPMKGYATFGDLTLRLVGREATTVGFPANSNDLLFAELRQVIVDQLGVDPDKVTRDARLVEDLGLD